jgi:hypothetical protein
MSKGTTRYLHGIPMAFLSIKDGTTIHGLQFRVFKDGEQFNGINDLHQWM